MDAVALRGGEVRLDLGRELVLPGEQERAVGLGVPPRACVGEAEVVDGAALARVERAAGLQRQDRLVVLLDLQVDEAEVEPVRRVRRGALDQLLVDRLRLGELLAAEVRETEQCEDAGVVRLELERGPERRLGEIEAALLELFAARGDGLIQRLAIAHGSDHGTD